MYAQSCRRETQKQQHGSQGPNDLVVPFPNSLVRKIPYEFLDRLQDEQDGEDDRLHLRRMQTDELFDPSVHKTLAAAKRIIKNAGRDPDRIFVVGGFGSSQYLVDQIREAFSPIPVFSPPNAPSAIMEGAQCTLACLLTANAVVHKEAKRSLLHLFLWCWSAAAAFCCCTIRGRGWLTYAQSCAE